MVALRDDEGDERYFEKPRRRSTEGFDAGLLREPLGVLPVQRPIVFAPGATVTEAMRAMQREHRGCVLVTDDGTMSSKLIGIFTERDVLFRIVDKGRNPAALPIGDVMTPNPENLAARATVAYVLNKMSVGGFRHVPVVDDEHRPVCVISVSDVVTFLVNAFPREVLNLPTDPLPTPPVSREGA
jgi:CBS domain-containing protein